MQCVRQTVNVLVSVAFCLVVAMAVCAMDSVALPKNWEEMEMMYHSGFNDALLHLLVGGMWLLPCVHMMGIILIVEI